MVRSGVRSAVIALICGSAVATAMGVLSRSGWVSNYRSAQDDPSQRMKYFLEPSESLIPTVRGLPDSDRSRSASVTLPAFMTNDTAAPAMPPAASLAALEATHRSAYSAPSASLTPQAYSAATRGGDAGGYAYAYSAPTGSNGNGLAVNLAQNAAPEQSVRLGSDTPFSAPAGSGRRSGASAVSAEDFTGTSGQAENELSANPGELNSTLPVAAEGTVTGPVAPAAPIVSDTIQQPQASASGSSAGPGSALAVPSAGTVSVIGMAGLAALRRRRA